MNLTTYKLYQKILWLCWRSFILSSFERTPTSRKTCYLDSDKKSAKYKVVTVHSTLMVPVDDTSTKFYIHQTITKNVVILYLLYTKILGSAKTDGNIYVWSLNNMFSNTLNVEMSRCYLHDLLLLKLHS